MVKTKDQSQSRCAYCSSAGPFSREHVIPAFLYKAHPNQNFGYNAAADKFFTGELKIKDVCVKCNTGPLSVLDTYGKEFYEANGCARTFDARISLPIKYDFVKLSRWLLKISYNSARTIPPIHPIFEAAVPYIMRSEPLAYAPYIALEVVRNAPISRKEQKNLRGAARGMKSIPAFMFRVGPSVIMTRGGRIHRDVLSRFVNINAFMFTVVMFPEGMNEGRKETIIEVIRDRSGSILELDPTKVELETRVSEATVYMRYKDQVLAVKEQWAIYTEGAALPR